MRLHLVAVGQKMPAWVSQGYQDFSRRLPTECALNLIEIAAGKRSKGSDINKSIAIEGERMLAAIPAGALVIALDVNGKHWDTDQLAERLVEWRFEGRDVALLVGGPDGLAAGCLERSDMVWSLSRLTLPHALVRIVIAEQIYRAWSIGCNHPYHRR